MLTLSPKRKMIGQHTKSEFSILGSADSSPDSEISKRKTMHSTVSVITLVATSVVLRKKCISVYTAEVSMSRATPLLAFDVFDLVLQSSTVLFFRRFLPHNRTLNK